MTGLPLSEAAILAALADHVWQSTWVAAGAALLVWILRRHRASVRAAIWLAATLKFVVPFAVLAAVGQVVPWPIPGPNAPSAAVSVVQAVSQPFSPLAWDTSARPPTDAVAPSTGSLPRLLLAVWLCGIVLSLALVVIRARRVRRVLRSAPVLRSGREREALARVAGADAADRIAIRSAAVRSSPCVVGVVRPAIVWPDGLSSRLSDVQLDAVVQHEICHVLRRDNLAALAQAAVQAVFWFHPAVWWMGARWNDERERACDEEVLARAYPPEPYAEGLISVGEFCVAPETMAHATITGSRLTERIEAIMTQQTPNSLNMPTRAALVAIAAVLVTAPVLIGAGTGPAQVSGQAVDLIAPFRSQAALTSAPTPAPADRQSTTAGAQAATVDGNVTDLTGASVAGVTVTFTPVGGESAARAVVTDIDGRFSLSDVSGGEYDVRGQQPGFRAVTQRLVVRSGVTTKLNLNLPIGSLSEEVTIRGSSDPAQPAPIAEGAWQERLNSEPDNVALYVELAQLYYQQERFTESETLLARASALRARGLPEPIAPGSMAGQRGGNLNPPRKLKDVRPVYPRTALASRVAGTVVLEAMIGRDGSVHSAKILRSMAPLDQAALGAARLWQFSPTLLNGRPIDVAMTVTMNFELPQEAQGPGRR